MFLPRETSRTRGNQIETRSKACREGAAEAIVISNLLKRERAEPKEMGVNERYLNSGIKAVNRRGLMSKP